MNSNRFLPKSAWERERERRRQAVREMRGEREKETETDSMWAGLRNKHKTLAIQILRWVCLPISPKAYGEDKIGKEYVPGSSWTFCSAFQSKNFNVLVGTAAVLMLSAPHWSKPSPEISTCHMWAQAGLLTFVKFEFPPSCLNAKAEKGLGHWVWPSWCRQLLERGRPAPESLAD